MWVAPPDILEMENAAKVLCGQLSKIRPELGSFAICPYASKAKFAIFEEKLCRIMPNDEYDVIIYIVEDDIDKQFH